MTWGKLCRTCPISLLLFVFFTHLSPKLPDHTKKFKKSSIPSRLPSSPLNHILFISPCTQYQFWYLLNPSHVNHISQNFASHSISLFSFPKDWSLATFHSFYLPCHFSLYHFFFLTNSFLCFPSAQENQAIIPYSLLSFFLYFSFHSFFVLAFFLCLLDVSDSSHFQSLAWPCNTLKSEKQLILFHLQLFPARKGLILPEAHSKNFLKFSIGKVLFSVTGIHL